jgi:myosin-5
VFLLVLFQSNLPLSLPVVLESNPVLEAFGNARTIRNDNSSRFGKFVELQFKHTGSLIGACIETYLLEKVRLIHQGPGERNFHVFYEMLAAATPEERQQFYLGHYTARDFRMTCASQTFDRRDGANDSQLFDQLVLGRYLLQELCCVRLPLGVETDSSIVKRFVAAMRTLGFDPDMQMDIFGVTTAFLHASNLEFVAISDDSSKVDDSNPHLEPVLKLLGLEKNAFQSALCEFDIEAGSMSYTRHVNKALAKKGLKALIKATYGAMFSFIAQKINKRIDCKSTGSLMHGTNKAASIYVLDIFGFESFPKNSFEQLCINYCNEALQQQFNLFIFKTEQEEYKREGITWEFIEFPDNRDVLDLIDHKRIGILSILTDQCLTPRGTDNLFADTMYKTCGEYNRFTADDLQRGNKQFTILHYAGSVTYDTEGFVEKNKDEIPRGASQLLQSSKKEFVRLLGKIAADPFAPSSSLSSSGRAKKRPTVAHQFKKQLEELRRRIELTMPHYIRCLKPNESLQPNEFDKGMVASQLRNAGVLEAIRVSRAGYSQRFEYSVFLERYGIIAKNSADSVDALANAIAKMIWSNGNTKAAM